MTYPFEIIEDEAKTLIAGVPSRGLGSDWFVSLVKSIGEIDDGMGEVQRGLADVEEAMGIVLDIQGDLLREPRGGLSDHEYRRILSGKTVARNAVSVERVWAGWLARTGTTSGTYDELAPASVYLTTRLGWVPTSTYLQRAGEIVHKLIGASYEANAVVYLDSSCVFDKGAGFDYDDFAYDMRVMGYK